MKMLCAIILVGGALAHPAWAAEPAPAASVGLSKPGTAIETNATPGLRMPPTNSLFNDAPAAGIYKTEPYTCLVIVPGKHPDDRIRRSPSMAEPSRMPIQKPELRFVPWGATRTNGAARLTNTPPQKVPQPGLQQKGSER